MVENNTIALASYLFKVTKTYLKKIVHFFYQKIKYKKNISLSIFLVFCLFLKKYILYLYLTIRFSVFFFFDSFFLFCWLKKKIWLVLLLFDFSESDLSWVLRALVDFYKVLYWRRNCWRWCFFFCWSNDWSVCRWYWTYRAWRCH